MMGQRHRHLDNDRLIALYVDDVAEERALIDLRECPDCSARYRQLAEAFRTARLDAIAEADAILTPGRLARQREEVLRRLRDGARAARVLPFPGAATATTTSRRRVRRWVAGAAAAGLLVGLTVGRMVDLELRTSGLFSRMAGAPVDLGSQALGSQAEPTVSSALAPWPNEESFLLELDSAIDTPTVAELQAIDALTPRIVEIAGQAGR